MGNIENIENVVVYKLIGEDVKMVLENMDRQDIIDDREKLAEVVEYLRKKFEIPDWGEYMEIYIDEYLERIIRR